MRLVLRVAAIATMLTLVLAGPAMAGFLSADLSVSKADSLDPVAPGGNVTYTITVQNLGPQDAGNVSFSDPLPAGMTFVSLAGPVGWALAVPVVGTNGTVSGTIPNLTVADGAQVFTLVVNIATSTPSGTVLTNVASVATGTSLDSNLNNNSSAQQTTVTAPAASIPNAAMATPSSGVPLATIGFTILLLALLSGAAILAVRRVRP